MKLTDRNLAEVLQALSTADRAALSVVTRPPGDGQESGETTALAAEAIRKVKARLKRRARRRRAEAKYRWLM